MLTDDRIFNIASETEYIRFKSRKSTFDSGTEISSIASPASLLSQSRTSVHEATEYRNVNPASNRSSPRANGRVTINTSDQPHAAA